VGVGSVLVLSFFFLLAAFQPAINEAPIAGLQMEERGL